MEKKIVVIVFNNEATQDEVDHVVDLIDGWLSLADIGAVVRVGGEDVLNEQA